MISPNPFPSVELSIDRNETIANATTQCRVSVYSWNSRISFRYYNMKNGGIAVSGFSSSK